MSRSRADKIKHIASVRTKAEEDLIYFAKLMNPNRLYGEIHEDLFEYLCATEFKKNKLALLPRGHQKSHCAAVKVVWDIVRDPTTTILYISATAQLAEAQLFAIKQMMSSDVFQLLWPEHINAEESKRRRWTSAEVIIDHPSRAMEGIRDFTVAARGLTGNITGLHADKIYLDDIVIPNNAYTQEGRDKVEAMYSQLASIKNPGAEIFAVGTRYHPKDLYDVLRNIEYNIIDEDTLEIVGKDLVYDVMERRVEEEGVFLWPKTRREDGKFYGFDMRELEKIKAEYVDTAQFFAQYYNNPNDPENARIGREKFQHYDRKHLNCDGGIWFFKERKLNVFAAIDFAFSLNKKADYTALVVIGVDNENNTYILEIDRFKTDKISIYFEHVLAAHLKWGFKKLRAEVTVGQQPIVRELKDGYIKPYGLSLSVDEYRPSRHEGTKEERISSILEPRYDNLAVWHYKGGACVLLEEELILAKPPHDDIKDALASAIDIAVAPKVRSNKSKTKTNIIYSGRFGGVSYRDERN